MQKMSLCVTFSVNLSFFLLVLIIFLFLIRLRHSVAVLDLIVYHLCRAAIYENVHNFFTVWRLLNDVVDAALFHEFPETMVVMHGEHHKDRHVQVHLLCVVSVSLLNLALR